MEILSRSSEEDEDEYLRREGDFTVRFDGKNAEQKQQLLTPRSKHSAMEQRRRSKINDRQRSSMNLLIGGWRGYLQRAKVGLLDKKQELARLVDA
ncbi:uncharacterized protein A4U43_C07F14230 [Asparagus officinalis]|uniref:BHLH domain-containing protein n=1 Tax=Asparagus officinalis TaxID=4686 RepID=A0A5P1EET8_ASPOF|nr:uncharacterized protein A4U43_C07F14230 [Asparagus officinalis]